MARTNRDDFSTSTKDKAAKRSAYRCAFCGKPTIGPSFENNEAVSNTGVAAHICAAAPGGKRYDPNMTPEQRKSIDNCVWMCQTHAHLIDTDEVKYSVAVLKDMKQKAELAAAESNADIEFFKKYYESKNDDTVGLESLLDQMIADGNFDLLRNTLECYSSAISPVFDEIVCRYHIIYDMFCSNDMIYSHIEQFKSLPIKSGADKLIELFIAFNYSDGIKTLLEYCSDDDLKMLAELLINNELEKKVICSSANDPHFEFPKSKEGLLYKYILCVAKQKEIYNLMDEKGEKVSFRFNENYFQLIYSAFSLVGKTIYDDLNFESNPEDMDYNYIAQRKKIIKQLNIDAQTFIWGALLQYVFLTPKEFNHLVSEIPAFIREEVKIEQIIWMFKIKNRIDAIDIDDLMSFSNKHRNYSALVKYLSMMDDVFRYEFVEEHKYLLKKDSRFMQLYTKNPDVNMTYENLLKYGKYYPDDFLYHCLCYDYADCADKECHFMWIIENKNKLPAEQLPYYLEILSKESRYDLLLEVNKKAIANDARLFIANQLAATLDISNILEARKIYEYLIENGCNYKTLHYNYAVLISKFGKFEEAKKHLQKEYDLYKDPTALHYMLHLRYGTNSVVDDAYLDAAKVIAKPEFQYLVAASYVQLQEKELANVYYLRTLLLDENSKCIGMLFSLNQDRDFADATDIRTGIVCALTSDCKTIKIAIHDPKVLKGINPNNFANCIHLSSNDPSISSLLYAKAGDTVQFESDSYRVEEISALWKYLSGFSFSKIIDDEKTIKIQGETPEDAFDKIKSIMLDHHKELDTMLKECNTFGCDLPLSAFSHQIGKSCLETCEFLALCNAKKIWNNMSHIPNDKENIYVLSFDAIVLLAVSGMLPRVSALPNFICPVQVKNQIDSEITELLNDLESKCSRGSLILVDGAPCMTQLSDEAKRDRYKYLTEIRTFINLKSADIAYDFRSDEVMFDELFSNSNTLIESGALGLVQNIENSILVTDNQSLYSVANATGLANVGLCDVIIQLTDSFIGLFKAVKELQKLNFSNYFPLFVFVKMVEYLSKTPHSQERLDNEKALINWLLSDNEGQEATEHHSNVIIQLFRDYLSQNDFVLEDDSALKNAAMYHFAKLHPEVVKKAISDFRENIKIQITCDDEIQSED